MSAQYFVIQEYSQTNRRCLWKVISQPQADIPSARALKNSAAQPKGKGCFVGELLSEEECMKRLDAGEQFNLDLGKQYYAVCEYSPEKDPSLWKVLSRPMKTILSAWSWKDFQRQDDSNKGRRYFVVERIKE